MNSEWYCRNINAATFIRYALGDEHHVRTEVDSGRATCVFSDHNRARELQAEFFAGPVAVGDLRAFLEVAKEVRATIRAAESAGGVWERKEEMSL
jgi:hypothetical protein